MEHEQAVRNLAVESYFLGEMSSAEREAFEEHYFECAVCAEDVRSAHRFVAEMKEILSAERTESATLPRREVNLPSRAVSGSRWLAWLQPQFAGAAIVILAVVAGVESLSTISLRRQIDEASAPRIVKPQVLRPQTRGTPSVLTVAPGEPALLTLDLDIPASPASAGVRFVIKSNDIKSNDGRAVLEIHGDSVSPGEPVLLSVPRLDLPAGRYDLVVEAIPNGQELARYPFELRH